MNRKNLKILAMILLAWAGFQVWLDSKRNDSPTVLIQDVPHVGTARRETQKSSKTMLPSGIARQNPLLEFDAGSFSKLVKSTDPLNDLLLTASVQTLRSLDSKRVVEFFMNSLARIGPSGQLERMQLLSVAEAWQDDALLPFWEDLALRKTPFLPNEESIMSATEPSISAMNIGAEMTTAIRHLGIIAVRDDHAQTILAEIVKNPGPLHTTGLRTRALAAMQEGDRNAALRTLMSLGDDDKLRRAIRVAQDLAIEAE